MRQSIGRPLGGNAFIEALSAQLGRKLALGKRRRRGREEDGIEVE